MEEVVKFAKLLPHNDELVEYEYVTKGSLFDMLTSKIDYVQVVIDHAKKNGFKTDKLQEYIDVLIDLKLAYDDAIDFKLILN